MQKFSSSTLWKKTIMAELDSNVPNIVDTITNIVTTLVALISVSTDTKNYTPHDFIKDLTFISFQRNWMKKFSRLWLLNPSDMYLILVLGPSRSLARLGFGLSFWEKKLSLAFHAFQKARLAMLSKKLGSAWLAISWKKSSVQLGLLYHLKNQVTLKNKKWADFQHFCQFFKV